MNIGFFSDSWEPQINGVVVSIRNLAQALHGRGHRVFHYAPAIGADRSVTPEVFRQRAVTYPFQKEFCVASPCSRRALRRARYQNLDLVHGHTEFSLGLVAASAARLLEAPFVFTLHTLWLYYSHYLFWGLLPLSLLMPIMRRFYRRVDYFVAPSSKIRAYLEKEFHIEAHIETIPTGLDLDMFHNFRPDAGERLAFRRRHGIGADDPVLIFAGRLGLEKSIDLLIAGLPALLKRFPALKLMLVGDGPARGRLEDLAQSLGVRRSVVFTGYLPHARLPLAYKSADLFAIASTTETQGLVTVEAMASGLPVVAREDAAQLDSLGCRENGLVFADEAGFVKAVSSILERPGLKAELSGKSIERSAAFTLNEFGERMEIYYKWLIEDFKRNKSNS